MMIAILLVINPAAAQTQEASVSAESYADPYLIEGVAVDVTADNAVEARKKAFEEAQIKAYEALAARLLTAEELSAFAVPDIARVAPLVKNFEVTKERLSAVRYQGVYSIRFSPRAHRAITGQQAPTSGAQQKADEPFAPAHSLLLPFYEIQNRSFLWQINPFLAAFKRAQTDHDLRGFKVPVGDQQDIRFIRDGQMKTYDPASLNAMIGRYGVQRAIILTARQESDPVNQIALVTVGIYAPRTYGPELLRQLTVRGYQGEVEEQLYGRVVSTTLQALQSMGVPAQDRGQTPATTNYSSAARPVPVLSGAPNSLSAVLTFTSPREWVEAKQAMEQIKGVNGVMVQSLSARTAILRIDYQGSVDALRQALFVQGLVLREDRNTQGSGTLMYQLSKAR